MQEQKIISANDIQQDNFPFGLRLQLAPFPGRGKESRLIGHTVEAWPILAFISVLALRAVIHAILTIACKSPIKYAAKNARFMRTASRYTVSAQKSKLNLAMICKFLDSCYWAKGIPRSVVARSIRNSLCFGIFHRGEQVGFGRVITDRATFAYFADVFVLPEHRGRGLAKMLIARMLAHRDLQGLRRIMLSTQDAHGLYAPFGFKPLEHPENVISIAFPGVYQKTKRKRRRQIKRQSAP